MKQYHDLLKRTMLYGYDSDDRTHTGTVSSFGEQIKFDLGLGFPAVTTKKLAFNAVKAELLWFISGSTNVNDLRAIQYGEEYRYDATKRTVWDDNYENEARALGYEDGQLGPVYGRQWRDFSGASVSKGVWSFVSVDQLRNVIEQIKTNPSSRRLIVSAWNPCQIEQMALPPCHMMFHFRVYHGRLSCLVYIRSNDLFLGAPFNIASYALLTHMVAQVCGLDVGELVYTIGDAHIYKNHIDQTNEMLRRQPYQLPVLKLNPDIKSIDNFKMEDIQLIGYQSHDAIKAPMAFKKI